LKYRSRSDIVSHILEAANGGTTKTKIMYVAYLSYAQLKDYLAVLMENGLIEHDKAKQQYRTTPRGMTFLKAYRQMGQMMTVTND
jgi:predicted transcriptional regulator